MPLYPGGVGAVAKLLAPLFETRKEVAEGSHWRKRYEPPTDRLSSAVRPECSRSKRAERYRDRYEESGSICPEELEAS